MRKVRVLLYIMLLLLAATIAYVLFGSSSDAVSVTYKIRIDDPTDGTLTVSMNVRPSGFMFSDLYLKDSVLNDIPRTYEFSARRGRFPLASWQAIPGFADVRRVWTGFSRAPFEITYTIDPNWFLGTVPRSFLGTDFAYLRGMVFLYTPVGSNTLLAALRRTNPVAPSGYADLYFALPEGWSVNSPYGDTPKAINFSDLRDVYFGLGQLAPEQVDVLDTSLWVGVLSSLPEEQQALIRRQIPLLFAEAASLTGFMPQSKAAYWAVSVFRERPIHGGATGINSVVCGAALPTVAQYIFNWWNGEALKSTADALWIEHGFATYYAAKLLYLTDAWSKEQFELHLEELERAVFSEEDAYAVDLTHASLRLASGHHTQDDYDAVYYIGALLAAYLDQRLEQQSTSLDRIWARLYAHRLPFSTDVFLHRLEEIGGNTLRSECEQIVRGLKPLTPD